MEELLWQKSRETLLRDLQSGETGLTSAEAARRLERDGPNELPAEGRKSLLRVFGEQFRDFLVIVLLAAAGISAALGDGESAVVILVVLLLNAALGTAQTLRAASSLESLKRLSAPAAKVLRDGAAVRLPGREVVVGDVVVLEAGDFICADGRLLECAGLKCAESALTGESLPTEKDPAPLRGEIPLGDRKNMVFSGCFVTCGRARFVVTATGARTEMGRIAALLQSAEERKTPLQRSLEQFGKRLTAIILALCVLLFAVSVFVRGEAVMDAFLFAVALAVAAIPEALSSIVTIVLSFSTQKMARERAVIRRLQAVEALGSVSVICSDKTGTLTQNRMTVKQLYAAGRIIAAEEADFRDAAQEALLRTALLCSDAVVNERGELGDPTETALVRLGEAHGVDEEAVRGKYPRVGEVPFDSERKLMSTVHDLPGGRLLAVKGAADVLLERCILGPLERAEIERVNEAFSARGLRVLAFACRRTESAEVTPEDEQDLTFRGLIAMIDPPREESAEAVRACIAAGIRPIMITGDHKVTASAIAKELGILLPGTRAVEGKEIEKLSDAELRKRVSEISVYARVSPEHKIRIVRAWQELGNPVAMTGDGVNDAPALKQADIGVAMGITGTEVAKDAAGMVLADDHFATIVKAVENGRNVYANIKRAIRFLLSGNTAGILLVLYAALAGLPVPLEAVHLLFINLLTDSLPAIALGLEPHSSAVMQERPRPRNEGILDRAFLVGVVTEGLVIAAASAAAFHIGLRYGHGVGSTMAFSTLCLSRLLHGFNCKATRPAFFSGALWNNRALLLAFAVGTALLAAVLLLPVASPVLRVTALPGRLLGIAAGLSAGSMAVIWLLKIVRPGKD